MGVGALTQARLRIAAGGRNGILTASWVSRCRTEEPDVGLCTVSLGESRRQTERQVPTSPSIDEGVCLSDAVIRRKRGWTRRSQGPDAPKTARLLPLPFNPIR